MAASRMDAGFQAYREGFGFGIMFGWPIQPSDSGDFGTRMRSRGFVPNPRCAAFLVSPRRVSSPLCGAQENDLWRMRSNAIGLVRPHRAPGARSVLWRHARLPGARGAARAVQELWAREARTARLPGGQPVLYQAPLLSKTGGFGGWHADLTRVSDGFGADLRIVPPWVLSNIRQMPRLLGVILRDRAAPRTVRRSTPSGRDG